MARLPGLRGAQLTAPATHDTASAVAGITLEGEDWAYLSSGTWSLVGTPVEKPILTQDACAQGFTNFGGVGGGICFHKNVNGMWLLKECLDPLCGGPGTWTMQAITREAERMPRPTVLIDVDDAALLQPGPLAPRINQQLLAAGGAPLAVCAGSAPAFANLVFHSLAARYSGVLGDVERLSGKPLRRLAIVGGGSLNRYLNRLTAEATGLEVSCGSVESSTLGNFAVQLATLEGRPNVRERIRHWAAQLALLSPC
jgi:rhamnulokinase